MLHRITYSINICIGYLEKIYLGLQGLNSVPHFAEMLVLVSQNDHI